MVRPMEIPMTDTVSDIAVQNLKLSVGGMSCASCVSRVEKAINQLPGVLDVSVNLATEEAAIWASDQVSASSLVEAVKSAGYQAKTSSFGGCPEFCVNGVWVKGC